MLRYNRKCSVPILIFIFLAINHFGVVFNIYEEFDFVQLDKDIDQRVNELIESGQFNVSDYTDFVYGPGNTYGTSKKTMIASSDVRCSRVGAHINKKGGNAFDMLVGIGACLCVVEVGSAGFTGGGMFLGQVNGRIKTIDYRPYPTQSIVSNETFIEGGMAKGFDEIWKLGGVLEWKNLFDIPLLIAYFGFEIKPSLRRMMKATEFPIGLDPYLRKILFNGDSVKHIGDRIVNKNLARTIHLISLDYRNMYVGAIPSLMMKQIGEQYYDKLMREISQYHTDHLDTLSLDLNDERKMVTLRGNAGGALAAYIVNGVRGYKDRNPEVFHGDGSVDASYNPNLYEILNDGRIQLHKLKTEDSIQTIKEAYDKYPKEAPTIEIPETRKLINEKVSSMDYEYKETEDISGSASALVFDECGNAASMNVAINQLFGGVFSFPELGLVANTYTGVKVDENNNPIQTNSTAPKTFSAPVFVIGKSDNQLYQIYAGTGGRKIASAVAQVIVNHYYRNMTMGEALSHFRMFSQFDDNFIYSEQEKPIPEEIVNHIISEKGVGLRTIPYHYSSSVTNIGITRDKFGYPETIFGQGDFRRNGGVKGV